MWAAEYSGPPLYNMAVGIEFSLLREGQDRSRVRLGASPPRHCGPFKDCEGEKGVGDAGFRTRSDCAAAVNTLRKMTELAAERGARHDFPAEP
jgi:hypothetical protein